MNERLDELELDALTEIINIGVCNAAATLSELTNCGEVSFDAPRVRMVHSEDLSVTTALDNGAGSKLVYQRFSGGLLGIGGLLVAEQSSRNLVRCLLGEHGVGGELTEMEQETLMEVGNVVINSCMSAFADTIGKEVITDLPELGANSVLETVQELSDESGFEVVVAQVCLHTEKVDIPTELVFWLASNSLLVLSGGTGEPWWQPAQA